VGVYFNLGTLLRFSITIHKLIFFIFYMRQDIKQKITSRLKVIEGQVCGLQKMVDQEKYCVDIITQISAVEKSLSSVGNLMLENHLVTHVIHQIKHEKGDQAVTEILKIYKLAQRK